MAVFYISFYADHDPPTHTAFYIGNLPTSWKPIEEHLCARAAQLERMFFRVDWMSNPNTNTFGCALYNLDPNAHEQLIHLWRQTFCETWAQCVVGPLCTLTTNDVLMGNMSNTKDAYEQQQAEQLRTTLNQQLDPSGSVAAPKKM